MHNLSSKKNDNINIDRYLDLNRICNEHRVFHNDYSVFDNFKDEDKENFLNDNMKVFSKFLYLIQVAENREFMDMKITYTLFGVAYEYLLKICSLKINWDDYLSLYRADPKDESNRGNRSFETAKIYVLKDLKLKLPSYQHKRSREILDFVQHQRNHFAHNPFKGMDHYAVTKQIYELMSVLIATYQLKLPKETVELITEGITNNRVRSGMDFKDVEFQKYIDNLNDCALDIPLFPECW